MTESAASLFKIRHAWKAGGASSSETEYFESRVGLEVRLLRLLVDMESRPANHERRGGFMPWLPWRYWAKRAEVDVDSTRYVTRILNVEELVDMKWVPLEYEVTPPRLVLRPAP